MSDPESGGADHDVVTRGVGKNSDGKDRHQFVANSGYGLAEVKNAD